MSFLATVGKDFKAVFSWLGSTKGQAVIGAVEAGAEIAVPSITPAITLINTWMAEIIKTESLAASAASQTGSGTQKAAVALSTMTPQVLSWAAANGYSVPNSTQISAINSAMVNVLNLLGASTTSTTNVAPLPAPTTTGAVDGGKAL